MAYLSILAILAVTLPEALSADTTKGEHGVDYSCWNIRSVPDKVRTDFNLPAKYIRYTEAFDIPIVSTGAPDDAALSRACYLVVVMFGSNKSVGRKYCTMRGYIEVLGKTEYAGRNPDSCKMPAWWVNPVDESKARAVEPTLENLVTSIAEENLLCGPQNKENDWYYREELGVHVLAHTFYLTLSQMDSTFDAKAKGHYDEAMANNLWQDTYAATSHKEYFAEVVQSYFAVNDKVDNSASSDVLKHNGVNGKPGLVDYDIKMFEFVHDLFPCPNRLIKKCADDGTNTKQQVFMFDCDDLMFTEESACKDTADDCASIANDESCADPAVSKKCKFTCGFCGYGYLGKYDKLKGCHDHFAGCRQYAAKDLCRIQIIAKGCKVSCQFCNRPAPARKCKDRGKNCEVLMAAGDCDNPVSEHRCRRTCNACHKKRGRVCYDKIPNCDHLVAKGLCKTFGIYKQCQSSCGGCHGHAGCKNRDSRCHMWKNEGKCGEEMATAKCPKACGLCMTHGQIHKGYRNCRDKAGHNACKAHKLSGQCGDSQIRKFCRRTCGMCSRSERDACKDESTLHQCQIWKAERKCSKKRFKRQCKKTCNVCSYVSKNCRDNAKSAKCKSWDDKGFCQKRAFQKKCQKTCGICMPDPQTECADKDTAENCMNAKNAGSCSKKNWQTKCEKTCEICTSAECLNLLSDQQCEHKKSLGKCTDRTISQKCLKTCNLCTSPQTECHDAHHSRQCKAWKSKGKCVKPNFQRKCRKTCNVCQSVCKDYGAPGRCAKVVAQEKCDSLRHARHCKKSCGVCDVDFSLIRHCKDRLPKDECQLLAENGGCEDKFQSMKCRDTCGLCHDSRCKDRLEGCDDWGIQKRCHLFPVAIGCRKTCRMCGIIKVIGCNDRKPANKCKRFKKLKLCDRHDVAFNCKKTCQYCIPASEPTPPCKDDGDDCAEITAADPRSCRDHNVVIRCRKSCDQCFEFYDNPLGRNVTLLTTTNESCQDVHDDCEEWLLEGKCDSEEAFSLCKQSCGLCQHFGQ